MGKLSFNQKTASGFQGLKSNSFYKVKSLLGSAYLSDIFNASNNYSVGVDTIYIWQNGNINLTPIVALNNNPEWIDPITEQNIDNTLIPVGAVVFINSSLNHSYAGAILVNYYQGKISIKKQNLTSLKVGGGTTVNNPSSVYVFKGGSINTLADIFNPINFQVNDTILITSLELFLNDDYDFLFQVDDYGAGKYWTNDIYAQTNMNNYVIPVNYIIYFNTSNNNNIQVSNGAIIQRYSNGKMTLKKN
jgi:hypothetical protein